MSRTNNPSKVKNKNDGRSSYRDILGFTWKKEGNKYVQYRGNGTKTGKTKPIVKEQPKYVSPRERKFGKDKKKDDLKVNKKSNELAEKTKIPSGSNLKAGSFGISETGKKQALENKKQKKVTQNKTSGVGPVKDGKTYAKNLKNTTQGIGPVKDGKTYGKNLTKKVTQNKTEEKPKVTEKKQPKLIKKKKGKGFVSTKSARGKQLLKIEERKRKLREKRFGKK